MNAVDNNIWIMEIAGNIRLVYYRKLSLISIRREDGKLLQRVENVNDWTLGQLEDYVSGLKKSIIDSQQEKNPLGGSRGFSNNN